MTQFGFNSQKLLSPEEVIVIEPKKAFEEFVAPRLQDENWVEDSKKLTDTNMSSREWAGLVVYSLSLAQLINEDILVGKDSRNGDGVIVQPLSNGRYNGLFLEQSLVTHRAHNDLATGLLERIQSKSSKGEQYAGKQDLVLWCNLNGEINTVEIANMVDDKTNLFSIVAVVGFNKSTNSFMCYIFKKTHGLIGNYVYSYQDLMPV
jgi:hypothetical protein